MIGEEQFTSILHGVLGHRGTAHRTALLVALMNSAVSQAWGLARLFWWDSDIKVFEIAYLL